MDWLIPVILLVAIALLFLWVSNMDQQCKNRYELMKRREAASRKILYGETP